MPEYVCQKCGAVCYGWGSSMICPVCGGKLVNIQDFEKDCRDYMREGHVDQPYVQMELMFG